MLDSNAVISIIIFTISHVKKIKRQKLSYEEGKKAIPNSTLLQIKKKNIKSKKDGKRYSALTN